MRVLFARHHIFARRRPVLATPAIPLALWAHAESPRFRHGVTEDGAHGENFNRARRCSTRDVEGFRSTFEHEKSLSSCPPCLRVSVSKNARPNTDLKRTGRREPQKTERSDPSGVRRR